VEYQIKALKNKPSSSDAQARWVEREIRRLGENLLVRYYTENADGSLSCPPGLWWLCEEVSGHLNNEIKYHPLDPSYAKQPREYQVEAVKELLLFKRAMLDVFTGGGKSLIIAMLCHSAIKSGKRPLVIVPTIDLVEQTVKALKEVIPETCGIGGGAKFKEGALCAVTTIASAKGYCDMFNVMVSDECHGVGSDSYSTAILGSGASHAYGLTATPVRADSLVVGVHALCGPVVYQKTSAWGLEHKFLTPPRIFMINLSSQKSTLPDAMNQQKAYGILASSSAAINYLCDTLKALQDRGLRTLVLFKTRAPGEKFATAYNERYGTTHMVAHSGFRHPFKMFKDGKLDILISNSALLGTGIDVPSIDAMISVVNTSGEALTRQVLGRGLRLSPGKDAVYFFDVTLKGYGYRDKFLGYAQQRAKVYRTVTEDIQVLDV
jgi:DNA repair protein RadD